MFGDKYVEYKSNESEITSIEQYLERNSEYLGHMIDEL